MRAGGGTGMLASGDRNGGLGIRIGVDVGDPELEPA